MCSVMLVSMKRRSLAASVDADPVSPSEGGLCLTGYLDDAVLQLKTRFRDTRRAAVKSVMEPWVRWRGRKVCPVHGPVYLDR